jgi:hypothetical protein
MEGIRKIAKPRKRLADEVEEDLKIMGIRNWHIMARDGGRIETGCIRSQGPQRTVVLVDG